MKRTRISSYVQLHSVTPWQSYGIFQVTFNNFEFSGHDLENCLNWAAVWKSFVATVASDDDKQVASVLCSAKSANKVIQWNLPQFFWRRLLSSCWRFNVPGFSHSFITVDVCEQFQLPIESIESKFCLANAEKFPVLWVCSALMSLNNFHFSVSFSVVSRLIWWEILGLDFLSLY